MNGLLSRSLLFSWYGLVWLFHGLCNATCAWFRGLGSVDLPHICHASQLTFVSLPLCLQPHRNVCCDYVMSFCTLFVLHMFWYSGCEMHFGHQIQSTFCATVRTRPNLRFSTKSIRWAVKGEGVCCQSKTLWLPSCRLHIISKIFDATKGYPGEGHRQSRNMTFVTANIGSLKANVTWKTVDASVLCLQETRIGKNNERQSMFDVQSIGKRLLQGKTLPGLLQKNGRHRTAHGGTAILAPPEIALPFDAKQDQTGAYEKLFQTHRCNAAWIQVTRSIKALVFSFYGHTGVQTDSAAFDTNNHLIELMFEVANQFGDIPVLIGGDFQAEPLQYPAIANATSFWGWVDPLVDTQNDDRPRPITYSNDHSFSGHGDRTSSIDGFLLNRVAASALKNIEVVELFDSQHRPVKAVFQWSCITQVGYIHLKTAPFDLSDMPPIGQATSGENAAVSPEELWQQFNTSTFDLNDVETQWQTLNQYATQYLLQNGAKWGKGDQTRGTPPVFKEKKICPGQLPSGAVKTQKLFQAYKALNQLNEISCRLQRGSSSPADWHITRATMRKLWHRLHALNAPNLWPQHANPDLVDIHYATNWIQEAIRKLETARKTMRIARWKDKVKTSSQGTYAYVFEHLKNKNMQEPPNLITTDEGNIIFQPQEALDHINNQWDDVFSVNLLQEDPMDILKVIWPYIKQDCIEFALPNLEATHLFDVIQKRKPCAAPGLDGWRTTELQRLPKECFIPFAEFFRRLEENSEDLPRSLTCAKQMILNKNGQSEPLQKRLITVLPAILLAYTGARFQQLQEWQQQLMPSEVLGGIKGRYMTTVAIDIRLHIDQATNENDSLVGIKLDKSKCFDRIVPQYVAALFLAFGLEKSLVNIFLKIYIKGCTDTSSIKGGPHARPQPQQTEWHKDAPFLWLPSTYIPRCGCACFVTSPKSL